MPHPTFHRRGTCVTNIARLHAGRQGSWLTTTDHIAYIILIAQHMICEYNNYNNAHRMNIIISTDFHRPTDPNEHKPDLSGQLYFSTIACDPEPLRATVHTHTVYTYS